MAGGSVRACGGGGCIRAVGFTSGKWEGQGLGGEVTAGRLDCEGGLGHRWQVGALGRCAC